MRVLVIGCRGQVGAALMRARWPKDIDLAGAARPDCDFTNPTSIEHVVSQAAPDIVINAAAYTAVDKAESDPAAAFAVNTTGPEILATTCARRGAPLIHLSTDYVFDGTADRPYRENDPISPLNVYGASKAAGEAAVRSRQPQHVIMRTAWVYSAVGQNFVKSMLRLGREREVVCVVSDQRGTPTAAADVASSIVKIASQLVGTRDDLQPWGTYHFTAAGDTTWHGFAEQIFQQQQKIAGHRPKLRAITTAEFPAAARRPANSRLDCERVERVFGIVRRPWQQAVDEVVNELLHAVGQEEAARTMRLP